MNYIEKQITEDLIGIADKLEKRLIGTQWAITRIDLLEKVVFALRSAQSVTLWISPNAVNRDGWIVAGKRITELGIALTEHRTVQISHFGACSLNNHLDVYIVAECELEFLINSLGDRPSRYASIITNELLKQSGDTEECLRKVILQWIGDENRWKK